MGATIPTIDEVRAAVHEEVDAGRGPSKRPWGSGTVVPPSSHGRPWSIRWMSRGRRRSKSGFKSKESAEAALKAIREAAPEPSYIKLAKPPPRSIDPASVEPCACCGWLPPRTRAGVMLLHRHHIVPRHVGGSDDPSNLIVLCPNCHTAAHRLVYQKFTRVPWPTTPEELLARLRALYKGGP